MPLTGAQDGTALTADRTTNPPRLSPTHPIHRALFSHGAFVARHWLAWILSCVVIAVFVCYPFFFLYGNPTVGFSKLPYHVWTSAKRFVSRLPPVPPDVEIHQIWIHGSYMDAINHTVLEEALSIQDLVLGEKAGCIEPNLDDVELHCSALPSLKDLSWAFHSPLLYWNCSYDQIVFDENLLATVNNQSNRKSYFGFTLRPTSVFAGKLFEKNRLMAADALVITIFDRGKPLNTLDWNTRFAELAKDVPARWSIYPQDIKSLRSELFQFQFMPMSFQDDFILFVAYALMVFYVLVSVRKLRAFKSKFGLIIALFVELGVSMLASFSICGALKIDLAMMPREAYPFVIFVIGLENMFRLVNALLAYPPQTSTVIRIASAAGDVGHLSLASAGQNLFILWILAKVVSPGVASFCTFAAVAIIFDFFFHLTFFLAVLSVDVRRMELRDSIERRHLTRKSSQTFKPGRRYWFDAFLQGQLPISSRLAGSAVSICFILALNMHFFDNESTMWALIDSLKSILSYGDRASQKGVNFSPPPPINQARTPQAWLRIQDYNSAREVIKFIKADAHTIIARVYDPLNVVLAGSDRTGVPLESVSILSGLIRLLDQHLYPLVLVIISAVALVILLMQYLLWNELPEEEVQITTAQAPLSIKTLPQAHRLDIVRLETGLKGHFITVGLDRVTAVNLFDPTTDTYSISAVKTTHLTPPLWPITHMAIDDNGYWVALATEQGNIAFWNLPERRLSHFTHTDFGGMDPLLFTFVTIDVLEGELLILLVILPDGQAKEYDAQLGVQGATFTIGTSRLAAASLFRSSHNNRLIVAGKDGNIYVATRLRESWALSNCTSNGLVEEDYNTDYRNSKAKSIVVAQALCIAVVARPYRLDLFDVLTQSFIRLLPCTAIKGSSLRVMHSPRRECPHCRGAAVHSISFVYTHSHEDTCMMRTFSNGDDFNSLICLSRDAPGKLDTCKGILDATEAVHYVEGAGVWEATGSQAVIGIRRPHNASSHQTSHMASGHEVSAEKSSSSLARRRKSSLLRQRPRTTQESGTTSSVMEGDDVVDSWEVWSLLSTGEFNSIPLQESGSNDNELFVVKPGPIRRLGKRSVALAFGNTIKVLTLGDGRFEEDLDEYIDQAHINTVRRRKLTARLR